MGFVNNRLPQTPTSTMTNTLCAQAFRKAEEIHKSTEFLAVLFFFFEQCPHLAHLGTTLTSFKNSFPSSLTLLLRLEGSQTSSRFMWMKRTIWLSNPFFELCPSPTRWMLLTWTPHGLSEDSSAGNELDREIFWIAPSPKDKGDTLLGL